MQQAAPKVQKHFNILSFDSGGVWDAVVPLLTQRLTADYPKLLRNTDLMVGVAAGGLQVLALASGMPPIDVYNFFESVSKKHDASYPEKTLKRSLVSQFGDMRLGELSKRVVIPTFKLDNDAKDPTLRSWKPKIYHNIVGPDADSEELVVNVALRTLAIPPLFAPFQGHVSGVVVANNPAMLGLAQSLDTRNGERGLQEISLLSVGAGVPNRFVSKATKSDADLSSNTMLYIANEADITTVHFECRALLKDKYFRLSPHLGTHYVLTDPSKFVEGDKIVEAHDFTAALNWLERCWI